MVSGVNIKGISTCLPAQGELNSNIDWIAEELKTKLISTLGIDQRFVASTNGSLHYYAQHACEDLLTNLKIDRSEIGFLILVTQTGDSKIPNSVIQLQTSLELPQQTLALEINMGCSGFVQGMYTAQSLLHSSEKKYGLLVCGDLSSRLLESKDTGTVPLFSDGVSATLLSKANESNTSYSFSNSAINGDAIAIKENANHSQYLKLDGHKILRMGLQSVVPDVRSFMDSMDSRELDFYFFHQASKIINQTIIRKLGLSVDKCPETLSKYGNTSSATIPLTMSTVSAMSEKSNNMLICGFGTGLSWATARLELPPIDYLGIIHK